MAYRPALDGVRALAVYLVLAFHAGQTWCAGGFIGVDIFFVLSGYLVTSLIVIDLAAGRFRLTDFYARRVRRLLPAALVVLAAISLLWLAIASPVDRAVAAGDVRSVALYVGNWHFANTLDYFASGNNPTPVLHFWSLSVEEQFYAAWPLLVLLAWRPWPGRRSGAADPRRAARRLGLTIVALAAASLASLLWMLRHEQTGLAYYGTHARAYQLLAGALLAVGIWCWRWQQRGGRVLADSAPVLQVAGLAGLLVLAAGLPAVQPAVRGVGAAVAATLLLIGLEVGPAGVVARVLAASPVCELGRISYGTYLWHYPVILVIRRFVDTGPTALLVVGGLVATGLAALSHRLLEVPVRTSPMLSRHPRAVVVGGLTCSLLAGLVILPPVLHSSRLPTVRPTGGGVTSQEPRLPLHGFDITAASRITPGTAADGPLPPDWACMRGSVEQCIVVAGRGKRVLLMGDSHAGMLLPAFRATARREGFTLALAMMTGCPWHRTLVYTSSNHQLCQQAKDIWYSRLIPQFNPDVIVLASRATDHAIGANYSVESVDPAVTGATQSLLLARAAERTLGELTTAGHAALVVEPVPVSPVHEGACVSSGRYADECAFLTESTPSEAERAYRSLDGKVPGVHVIDIDPLVCPRLPVCDAVIAGTMVRRDHDHLTPRYAAMIADQIDALLHTSGAI